MLSAISHILLFVPLAAMITSDFRRREVSVAWLGVFAAACVASAVCRSGWQEALLNAAQNLLVVGWLAAGVILYVSIKHRQFTNPLRDYLGLGDVVFLLCLTPLFGVREYLLFLVVSLCLTLTGWGIWRLAMRRQGTVPLVGTLGITLGAYLLVKMAVL